MLYQYLLPALLATTAVAVPFVDISESASEAEGELVLFKRDETLETRDLELAEVHGVNLTEMYKHAMFKRDDGDHIVIWVARSFEEHPTVVEDPQGLSKRQKARPGRESGFDKDDFVDDRCYSHKRQDHTGPNGPFSGGVQAIYSWAGLHRGGSWHVGSAWENLVIAGSNSGANAVYKAKRKNSNNWSVGIGTKDVRNDADWTQKKARSFNGRYRASSKGGETCGVLPSARVLYEIVKTSLKY